MQTWNKLSDIPQHIAVIMDGNRRWARERGLPDIAGHYAGAKRIRSVVQSCSALDVEFLTIFAFSTENWKRSKTEVSVLLGLLRRYLEVDAKDLGPHGVRLKIVGNHALFDARTQNRGCTEFCVNGLMAGNRRTSRIGYDRKYKEISTQRPH